MPLLIASGQLPNRPVGQCAKLPNRPVCQWPVATTSRRILDKVGRNRQRISTVQTLQTEIRYCLDQSNQKVGLGQTNRPKFVIDKTESARSVINLGHPSVFFFISIFYFFLFLLDLFFPVSGCLHEFVKMSEFFRYN